MSKVFVGSVLLPGEQGTGLEASVEMGDSGVTLTSGDEQIGSWDDYSVSPSGKGAFRLDLDNEHLFFTPSSPSSFAEAMQVPLAPEVDTKTEEKPKYDIDAAIDEAIANVKPLKSLNDEDDILSKPVLTGIVVVSGALMAGLVGMSLLI
ncbi:MAG: hypothetical protein ACR2N2_00570 [Acidimicrobiia bacterium]